MAADEMKKRYVWQCRRGMKEVEFLLNKYLEELYDGDPPEKRKIAWMSRAPVAFAAIPGTRPERFR